MNAEPTSDLTVAETTQEPQRIWPWVLLVGVGSAMISVGRLLLADPRAFSEVLWAEDGLFPLCIHKADFWTCMADPFAGYFLFLPRLLAWPVSLVPLESWAVATNLLAGLFAGGISAIVFAVLIRAGIGWFASGASALLATLAPIVGLEVINALASSYKLLLFALAVAIAFPSVRVRSGQGAGWLWIAVLALVTSLTIPTTVVIVAMVVILAIARRLSIKVASVWVGAMMVGLIAQSWVSLTAEAKRSVELGPDSINAWADATPVALLTYWPGLSIGEYEFFYVFTLAPVGATGWLIVLGLLAIALASLVRGFRRGVSGNRMIGIGILILSGLFLGLIPTVIGSPSNRYYVVPALLWGTALFVSLDPWFRRSRTWVLALIVAVTLVIWWPAMAASSFRATPTPSWIDEVARVKAACSAAPDAQEFPTFSPSWPPNQGEGFTEPTHPSLPCVLVWRWL